MPNFCAAPNCTRKSTQSDLAFFRFPRDPTRCQKWVENCRRADLEDKTPDQLNKHYRLCAKHFETSLICRTTHNLREEFVGFLPYEADAEILAVKFHTTITEKWGLNMEYCRGPAYIVSSGFSSKMKVVASRLLEKYPKLSTHSALPVP
uniref:THAP-type domain-containing protein n=1 Tax=Bos mutus grunniens TaxID=30521 RepID=A0A8B9Y550_BOSMU